jgi:Ser/Thr protein kinase RdoA (MazF antagonist)
MLIAWYIAEQFELGGGIVDVKPYGSGLINDTYLVTLSAGKLPRAILQRINQRVFPTPVLIMKNLRTLLDYIYQQQADKPLALRDLRMPIIYLTRDGKDYYLDGEGRVWRALSFIEETRCSDVITSLGQAEEVGFALGRFHALVKDLDPRCLHDILPGFHITPHYLERFTVVAQTKVTAVTPELRFCFAFIEARRQQASVLEEAKHHGLSLRPIHGDPKLNNILFDEKSDLAVSIVDLDTVKPGLVHYDLGDCLRSCCNQAGECPTNIATVHFDLDLCRAILKGYFAETRNFLNKLDCTLVYEAIRLIPFELGLRFLTDHLEGNKYFKVNAAEQNLYRAMTQFQLTASIEQNESRIKRLVTEFARF